MRIDRIDGIGDWVLLHQEVIASTFKGFSTALAKTALPQLTDQPLPHSFFNYIRLYGEDELYELLAMIIRAYNPATPELPLIIENLQEHVASFHRNLAKFESFFIDKV